jgi:hypothetical protein
MNLDAVRLSLRLYGAPAGVHRLRKSALPGGMTELLAVTAGVADVLDPIAKELSRPSVDVRRAGAFFVEQILLAQGTNDYRLLGAHEGTSLDVLREHRKLLLRWVHPDVSDRHVAEGSVDRSAYASRVQAAWERLEHRTVSGDVRASEHKPQKATKKPSKQAQPGSGGIIESIRRYIYGGGA